VIQSERIALGDGRGIHIIDGTATAEIGRYVIMTTQPASLLYFTHACMHAGGEQFDINTLSAAPEKLEAGSYLLSLPHQLRNTHMEDTDLHKEHGLRIAGYIHCISGGRDDAAAVC
jgi:hypothetical protein